MSDLERPYLPAAGHDWALSLYDPVMTLLGGDSARRRLVAQADLQPGHRVLEIGCGTGALLLQIARASRDVVVTGLDPDVNALNRARRKAARLSASIHLDHGFADMLPYPDATFDRVFSCFMFHHLDATEEKRQMFAEVRRVLKRRGRVQLLDLLDEDQSQLLSWLHTRNAMSHNTEMRMTSLMRQAGLANPVLLRRTTMVRVLSIGYFQASVP